MTIAIGNTVTVVLKNTRGASDVIAVFDTPEAAHAFILKMALKHPGTYTQKDATHFKL